MFNLHQTAGDFGVIPFVTVENGYMMFSDEPFCFFSYRVRASKSAFTPSSKIGCRLRRLWLEENGFKVCFVPTCNSDDGL